jgi:mRNA export factor
LKFPTTSIAVFPDGNGYLIGSIEGRCGVKYIDLKNDKVDLIDDYCFKAHRLEEEKKVPKLWSVNGITFNKGYGTVATYGSDGAYYFWNITSKSRKKNTK